MPRKERKKDGSLFGGLRRYFGKRVMRIKNRNKVGCDLEESASVENLDRKYKIIRLLGKGNHGSVYMAEDLKKKKLVAVKILALSRTTNEDIKKEVTAMRILKHHPNIVTYISCHVNFLEETVWIVMGCIPGVRLRDIENYRTSEGQIAAIARECLQGISYIHQKNIVHNALHNANIMVGMDGSVKIVDFGNCLILEGEMRNEDIKKTDMMLFGMSIMRLYESELPYSSLLSDLQVSPGTLEINASSEFQDFLSRCLADDIEDTASAAELLRHPFLKFATPLEDLIPLVLDALEDL